jgi:hypothetical protein
MTGYLESRPVVMLMQHALRQRAQGGSATLLLHSIKALTPKDSHSKIREENCHAEFETLFGH